MLRLATKVTSSPTISRRSRSATSATARTSGPRAPNRVTISSSPTVSPSSTPARTSATAPPTVGTVTTSGRTGGGPGHEGRQQLGGRGLAARGPRVVAAQPLGVGRVEHGEAQGRVEPGAGVEGEGGVEGQPGGQHVAGRLGGRPQDAEGRPGPFGVDVVGGHRGHAAPVVDAGADQRAQLVGEVGRRLQMDVVGQDEAGRGDGPEELVGGARRVAVHRGPGLGQEVLDDHLLDVAVTGVAGGDGLQGVEPVLAGLADAHQQPGGERHGQLARPLQGGEPPGRDLVGRRAVGGQVGVGRLDHHPLAGRHRPQPGQVVAVERTGVGVGEQAGLLEHGGTGGGEVVDRRVVAVVGQPLGGGRIAVLGAFAQGEERLVAAGRPAGPGDVEDLVDGQVGRPDVGRRLGEGAVAAPVAAQHGERDEDLGREGHPGAERRRRGPRPPGPSARRAERPAARHGSRRSGGRPEGNRGRRASGSPYRRPPPGRPAGAAQPTGVAGRGRRGRRRRPATRDRRRSAGPPAGPRRRRSGPAPRAWRLRRR